MTAAHSSYSSSATIAVLGGCALIYAVVFASMAGPDSSPTRHRVADADTRQSMPTEPRDVNPAQIAATASASSTTAPGHVSTTSRSAPTGVSTSSKRAEPGPSDVPVVDYIKVADSCGPHYQWSCLNVRSAPSTSSPVVTRLRNDVILRTDKVVEQNGRRWYRVTFEDEWLRYPERVTSDWYVVGDHVVPLRARGAVTLKGNEERESNKRIVVDRSEQHLYAYEGSSLFMDAPISTGVGLTPTPRGTFTVYKKMPSRYMQGPIEGLTDDEYDLPGVPWNLYFTQNGAVIHGAYWHDNFGRQWSHGCVNLSPDTAERLYKWAGLGTKVVVRN